MEPNFDEDDYKFYLAKEIVHSNQISHQSRFDESFSGIDTMLLSYNQNFWNLFGRIRTGLIISEDLWDGIKEGVDNIDIHENFHANVLLQYKVPQYLKYRGTEYGEWGQPYYRYKIRKNQNDSLAVLETNAGSSALVAYACPVTNKYTELRNFANNNSVAINSNFTNPDKLKNHSTYTFIAADKDGKAHSESEDIESFNLFEKIKELKPKRFDKNSDFIIDFANTIETSIKKADSQIQIMYHDVLKSFGEIEHEFGISLTKIFSYMFVHKLSWFIVKN